MLKPAVTNLKKTKFLELKYCCLMPGTVQDTEDTPTKKKKKRISSHGTYMVLRGEKNRKKKNR